LAVEGDEKHLLRGGVDALNASPCDGGNAVGVSRKASIAWVVPIAQATLILAKGIC
jgi:hypothetical protein